MARAKSRSLSGVIPRRYRDASWERPPVADMPAHVVRTVRTFADGIDARLDAGDGLWFMGDVGTGKTMLAMLVSKAALSAGRTVAIYSAPRLISLIRRTYDDDSTVSDIDLIERLASVDLLHIDDLGAGRPNEWVLEQLYSIVNSRYEEQRAIVATSNPPTFESRPPLVDQPAPSEKPRDPETAPDRLRDRIGERTYSRLTEMCEQIPVFGADLRDRSLLRPA